MVLAFLALALAHEQRGRQVAAGWWLGVAIALKVTPVLLVLRALAGRRPREAAVALLTAWVLTVGAPAMLIGRQRSVTMARSFVANLSPVAHGGAVANTNVDWRYTNQSLEALLQRALTDYGSRTLGYRPFWNVTERLSSEQAGHLAMALRLALLLGLVLLTWRLPRMPAGRLAEPALWVLAMLFLSPLSWANHYVVALLAYGGLLALAARQPLSRLADLAWRAGYLLAVAGWMRLFQHLSAMFVGHVLIAATLVASCLGRPAAELTQDRMSG